MDQQNGEFMIKVQNSLLSIYAELGRFMIKNPDDTRGRFFFSEKPDKNAEIIGNSCLRLILECIMMWPSLYPESAKFKSTYESLLKAGVNFPKEVNYFKKKTAKNPGNIAQSSIAGGNQGFYWFFKGIFIFIGFLLFFIGFLKEIRVQILQIV